MGRKYVTAEEIETIVIPADEQEVAVSFYRKGDRAKISVSDNTFMTKISRAVKRSPDDFVIWEAGRDRDNNVMGYNIECPKSFIHIVPKRENSRVITEEQKAQAAERLKKYWKDKRDISNT